MPPFEEACVGQPFVPFNDHIGGVTEPCDFTPNEYIVDFDWTGGAAQTYFGVFFDLPCADVPYSGSFTLESSVESGQLVCGITAQDGGDYADPADETTTPLNFIGLKTTTDLFLDPEVVQSGAYKLVCFSAVEREARVTISTEAVVR